MEKYRQERSRQEKFAKTLGIVLTVGAHAALVCFGTFSGLKYIYPPPEENTFLIDFSEEQTPVPVRRKYGSQPRAVEVDRSKSIDLVQQSEAQHEGSKANLAAEATVDDFGDVETYEPPREKPIERRALFHAADNQEARDTLAAQTAHSVSESLKAGHAAGNTASGKQSGEPNARLKGRKPVNGHLPKPAYESQESGTVVVSIWVDQYGAVKKAKAGAEGTTVVDQKLWAAARSAALQAHFNTDADAPALQEGTITYIFKLN